MQFDRHISGLTDIRSVRMTVIAICAFLMIFGFNGAGIMPVFCAFFILISVMLSGLIMRRSRKEMKIVRKLKVNRTFEQSYVPVEFAIENHSGSNYLFAYIEDIFPPASEGGYNQVIPIAFPLLTGQKCELKVNYYCNKRRGQYLIGPVKIRMMDPFGFATATCSDKNSQDFYVYPRPVILPEFPFSAQAAPFSIGSLYTNRLGMGQEFIGIRHYCQGDSFRHIHWPATARVNRVMIKEFEEIGAAKVSVFFDLNRDTLAGLGHHTTAEYAIKIAASIAKIGIDEGHYLQFFARGDTELYHPFGSGIWHLMPLMQRLCMVKPRGNMPMRDLISLNLELIPEGSCVIIIFSSYRVEMEKYGEIFNLLRAKNVEINMILIDHSTFLPLYEINKQEEKELSFKRFINSGIRVFRIRKGDDLGLQLMTPFNSGGER